MSHQQVTAPDSEQMDQRITLHGIPWGVYEAFLKARGDSAGVRVAYLKGELELMTPSFDHERIKTSIHTLLFAWSEETGTILVGAGSWTLKSRSKGRGAEPDQCYVLGTGRPKVPDIAIEVVWSSGGLDKLELYRALGVPEIWFWRSGRFEVFVLGKKGYQLRARSRLLPELDLALLARHLLTENPLEAVRQYRQALRALRSVS
jgi:Uma2 family endonuclease